jgi:hypothetical protein
MTTNKKIIAFLFAVMNITVATAQDYARPEPEQYAPEGSTTDKKFSVGLSFGSAIPLGKFASTSVKGTFWDFHSVDSTHLEGFAKNGFNFTLTASYLFPGNVGIMVMYASNSNAFDINTFSASVGLPSSTNSELYSENEYLIGPFVVLPEGNFRFTFNALVGLASVAYPEITCNAHDTTYTYDFQGGSGFAYDLGAGAEYNFSKWFAASLNINYMNTTIQYNGYSITGTIPGYIAYYSSPTDVLSMPTGILKITAGIVLRF